jgi:hypothetical protein
MSPQGQVGGNESDCNGESSGAEEADEEEACNNAESEGAESQVDDERSVASMLGGHVLIELLGAPKGRDLQEDEISMLVYHHCQFDVVFHHLWSQFLKSVQQGTWDDPRVQAEKVREEAGLYVYRGGRIRQVVLSFSEWGRHLRDAGRINEAEAEMTMFMWARKLEYPRGVKINGVVFRAGDWVISRPTASDIRRLHGVDGCGLPRVGPPKQLWAGCIKRVIRHAPGLKQPQASMSALLDVEWHEGGSGDGRNPDPSPFDVGLQCPQLRERVFPGDRYAKCTAVLPMRTVCKPHPLRQGTLVLLRRSFHCLGAAQIPVPWPPVTGSWP